MLKRHQDHVRAGLADVNQRLAEHDSLRLLTDAHRAYARSGDADWRRTKRSTHDSTSPTTSNYGPTSGAVRHHPPRSTRR